MVSFGITFYYMIIYTVKDEVQPSYLTNGVKDLPRFLVTVIFAMEGIGTIMPVENSMLKPNFIGCPGVLNISMGIVVSLYAAMGLFGYYVFGATAQGSITYNLPNENLAMAAKGCISAAVFFTFMLQFYVPMEISWRNMHDYFSPKYYNIIQIIWRIIAVIFITVIALSVPDLTTIIDLVGAIFFSTLGLFIPAVLDIIVNWDDGLGCFNWRLYKNLFIMFIAVFALCSGTYFAVDNLITGSN
ncbi:hypothetical protein HHI36_010014 [Cryptolaemus montrouzieri]|uniref:Amino acid transporter transmembrane domain-containing protein n=1 Tax=Cryptolaemus montrouzieri TaxID=559131 RepID=A0ABD2MHL6_9CUCU